MVYDNWERLVEATLDREKLRQIALSPSLSSSTGTSDFSFDSDEQCVGSPLTSRIEDAISLSHNARCISFKELEKATRSFQLDFHFGEGGFGTVFKGWLHEPTLTAAKPGSGMLVAVKNWNEDTLQGPGGWIVELNYLSRLHHPNLVRFIGYCFNKGNLFLVNEFALRGSLENHLFRRGHESLSWATRIKVAKGAAKGLSFLHDLGVQSIHQGFKTADILLDDEFNAKLSGFGFPVRRTESYIAPEYATTGRSTDKCDVYGFGIILLELLSGRRFVDTTMAGKELNLVDELAKLVLHDKKNLIRIMDPKLEGRYPRDRAYTLATLALQCLCLDPELRPRMAEVLVAIENV